MPLFRYVAKKSPTETVEEVIEADDRDAALQALEDLGYTPLKVVEDKRRRAKKNIVDATVQDVKIPFRILQIFIRQFASLTRSQVPMVRALTVLKEQSEHLPLKKIVQSILDSIQQEGQSLSDAMKKFPKAFSPDFVSLIQAGEVGGAMEQVLDSLDKNLSREQEMRTKINSALVYPLFVALMGVLTVIFLLTFVMPKILDVIQGFGGELPIPTRILIGVTGLMTQWPFWIFIALMVLGGMFLFRIFKKSKAEWFDGMLLKLPMMGKLIHRVEIVRFCRSLSLLLIHGVLLLPALETALQVVGNSVFKTELNKIMIKVKEGSSVTQGLEGLTFTTPFLLYSVSVGEESGRIGQSLDEVANYYESEAERLTQLLASFLEPIIILTIGLFIGFIVMAVLLPIFELSSSLR